MKTVRNYRRFIKQKLGKLWGDIQDEIKQYFKIRDKADILYPKDEFSIDLSREEYLDKFSLTWTRLKDPLLLPEIRDLLEEIKEFNFECFSSDSITGDYKHYDHAYRIKNEILPLLINHMQDCYNIRKLIVYDLIDGKIEFSEDKNRSERNQFIEIEFNQENFKEFNKLIESINEAARNEQLYRVLPILLRQLCENYIWLLMKKILPNKYTYLYYNPHKRRIRNFSKLIKLLDLLKDDEFIPYSKKILNSEHIKLLQEIRSIGNYNVHDLYNRVKEDFLEQWKSNVNELLSIFFELYNRLKDHKLQLEKERIENIEGKLNIN